MSSNRKAPRVIALAGALAAGLAVVLIGLHAIQAAHAAAPPANSRALPPLPDADTIHDDPTVAPDPKQSADKNVSLPADI